MRSQDERGERILALWSFVVPNCQRCSLTCCHALRQENALSEEPMSERHIRAVMINAAFMLLTAVISLTQTSQTSSGPVYLDPAQPVGVRVDDLISKMTLEEKAS